jgi:hypothetical protein
MTKVYKLFVSQALICLLICSSTLAPAWGQSAPSANGKTLIALETKFFEHTYPSDSDEDRIGRLEKLIFGESKSGDVQSRLAEIQKVVVSSDIPGGGSSSAAPSSQGGGSPAAPSTAPESASAPATTTPVSTAATPGASYPRVDALEELLLGQSNKKTALEQRLGLLEKKAFGQPSSSDDMSARTDALEQYWQKKLSPSLNQKYDRALTQLESQVIGQSYPDKPIIERLQTLEGIVFPNEPPDTHSSVKEQLDTLASAVQLSQKQGRKPSVSAVDTAQAPSQGLPTGYPVAGYPTAGQGQAGGGGGSGYPSAGQDQSQTAVNNAPGQYGSYGQANPYAAGGQSGNYGTQGRIRQRSRSRLSRCAGHKFIYAPGAVHHQYGANASGSQCRPTNSLHGQSHHQRNVWRHVRTAG